MKLSSDQSKQASEVLSILDKAAETIQAKFASWGLSQADAREMVNHLDREADVFEKRVFGSSSFEKRQAEVIQRDSDEAYMDSFKVDQGVIQAEADEPYMDAYRDDQSSAVRKGVSTSGRPLAPGHS